MTSYVKYIVCLFFFTFIYCITYAQINSVLSQGEWYKFSVVNDGVYKLTFAALQKAGINPEQIDPRNIKMYAGQEGMLPQANNKPRLIDLVQLSIYVSGEGDGQFNQDDYILFFAQGPNRCTYEPKLDFFRYEKNIFTDKNFYFLTISPTAGKRMPVVENVAGSFTVISEFNDYAVYETDKTNILKSGRQWFGEQFDSQTELTIQFNISGIVENAPIKFASQVMAQSAAPCSFNVFFNNHYVLEQPIAAFINSPYYEVGKVATDTVSLSNVSASSQTNQDIKYQFIKGTTPTGSSVGYLDYFLFSMKRALAHYGEQTIFLSNQSIQNPTSQFLISSASPQSIVWDITDPFNASIQAAALHDVTLSFSTSTRTLKKFIVFNSERIYSPVFEHVVANQNLHALATPRLIIITHPTFTQEAERLAAHRENNSGITAKVVTTLQIYNEYSGGKPDVTALRDFIRDLYKKTGSPLENVLLIGRGSYDYKNRIFNNTNFVPTYQSVNSLHPLESYSSDDYFGFLEDHEGAWQESPAALSTLDVGIGRLPVRSEAEVKNIIDKLIAYDTNPKSIGNWHKNILFVADDGDGNIHQDQANQLASGLELSNPEFDIQRLFLDAFDQIQLNTGTFSPQAAKALDLEVRKGQLIVNYTGHGSSKVWMQEEILNETLVMNWKNAPFYPLFVNATCEFGRSDDPYVISSAERLLLQPKGGGIGLLSSTRLVWSYTNILLNKAFYNSLLVRSNQEYRNLGAIFKDTKNNSINGVNNRNFSLLGDPSMRIALANYQAVASTIKTATNSNTLKGTSTVQVVGEIQNNGIKANQFTGDVYIKLYDKPISIKTKGDENLPFTFNQWSSILFQGQASVVNGDFQFEFVMPQNIDPIPDKGKLSLYAHTKTGQSAMGYSTNFLIGGRESNTTEDTTPPTIKLFLADTTFKAGGIVPPNTFIVAQLFDLNGINTSSKKPENNIIATLDGTHTFILNNYYVAQKDNFRKGSITYPIDTLKIGSHTLTLTVSDNFNNQSTTSIHFIITDGNRILLEEFGNFPNPVISNTQFWFTHNRSGEELEATLAIYNLAGEIMFTQTYQLPESPYQVILPEWNVEREDGSKLSAGLYIMRLFVRSLTDGTKAEKNAKFILLN